MQNDKLTLTIIAIIVLGHIIGGFIWLLIKIYKKKK